MAKSKKGTDVKKKIRSGVNKSQHSMNPGRSCAMDYFICVNIDLDLVRVPLLQNTKYLLF